MSAIKLSRSGTINLIKTFQSYECLWNPKNPNYKGTNLRCFAWHQIARKYDCDVDQIKKKIKYLRTSYLSEKKKVDESKKHNPNNVYEPNLFYFNEMGFLNDVIMLRKRECENTEESYIHELKVDVEDDSTSNMFLEDKVDSEHWDESNTNTSEQAESYISFGSSKRIKLHKSDDDEDLKFEQVESCAPFETHKRSKTHGRLNNTADQHGQSINSIGNCSVKNHTSLPDDMFILFGRSIVAQLKTLPLENASRAMAQIQNVVTEQTVSSLNKIQVNSAPQSSNVLSPHIV